MLPSCKQLQDVRPDGINSINISWAKTLKISWEKRRSACHACLARSHLRHNCWVVEIDLSNRPDVSGSLDKHFNELKNLKRLNLQNTKASGDIALLRNNANLKNLNLRNTMVFGDLAALQSATQLKDFHHFEVSNTKITCPQDAALKAVLAKLGFKEQQLQNLHAMEGLAWMLSSRSSLTFYSFAAYGLANNLFRS